MTNLTEFTVEELKTLASELDGFEYDGRWGEEKLRAELDTYLAENPIDGDVPPEEPLASGGTMPPDVAKPLEGSLAPVDPPEEKLGEGGPPASQGEGLVEIQSDYRGEIATSLGMVDFGEDGMATVSLEMADLLTPLKGYERC